MALKTKKFDIQDHLTSPAERAAYLAAAFEEADEAFIKQALSDIARSMGMTEVAKTAQITREGLYKALGKAGDPKLSTLLGIARALDVQLTVEPREVAA
tara:strand:+ start:9883 stop:10179 length:297 start_codon:yes stop_codon:yes gene_type:complete